MLINHLKFYITDFWNFLKNPKYTRNITLQPTLVIIGVFLIVSILITKSISYFYDYPSLPNPVSAAEYDIFGLIPIILILPIVEEFAFRGGRYDSKFNTWLYNVLYFLIIFTYIPFNTFSNSLVIVAFLANLFVTKNYNEKSSITTIVLSSIAFAMIHLGNFNYTNITNQELSILLIILIFNHGIFSSFCHYLAHKTSLGLAGSIIFHSLFNLIIYLSFIL